MKVLCLDLGDQWVGIAISDYLRMIAKPYTTTTAAELDTTLARIFKEEEINTIVVGHPKTLKGTESAQTKKIVAEKERLAKRFPNYTWLLWDERLSSQQAEKIQRSTGKKDKHKSHAIAAALVLETYLQYLSFQSRSE